jgi:phosphatidylserine/phosphatidylglycerophosphate/cardiolipin synthase-like enzyme
MLLDPGANCWRVAAANRAAVLIDMADYYAAAKTAFESARATIHVLNWAFDPDTLFTPEPGGVGPRDDRFGPFLRRLSLERPELDIRVLCWKSALPIAATQHFFPHRAKRCFEGSPVRFLLDATVPLGACHHQKMIVIDDQLAFCGGGDIGPDRWDTTEHRDDDPRRLKSPRSQNYYVSRHEVMTLVEGPAAAALGEVFRERWRRAAGDDPPPARSDGQPPWPSRVSPELSGLRAGISRSEPQWRDNDEVREIEALHLAEISAARNCIYLENQYFTSPLVADALADRLAEADGPEVILVSAHRSPSWFDQMTMDRTRTLFLAQLRAADTHGRLRAFVPITERGRPIIVHAKLAIVDDTLLRIGSANINNRSCGFDTECDLSFEPDIEDAANRGAIRAIRAKLLGHWLGCPTALVEQAITSSGGVGAAIDRLRAEGFMRLAPMTPAPLGPISAFIASHHLGDPTGTGDSWKPWARKRALARRQAAARAWRARWSAGAQGPGSADETLAAASRVSPRFDAAAAGAE